jgi:hypothetical protein
VHIWGDKWLPTPYTFSIHSSPKGLGSDAIVNALIDQDAGVWKLPLLLENFSNEEITAIQTIPINLTKQPDKQIWRGTSKGEFTVRSAYHMAKEKEGALLAGPSWRSEESMVWKGIWRANVPNAVKSFMWKACHNLLPTKENLFKRKVIPDPSCPICGLEVETTSHILWECASSADVWGASLRCFQKKSGSFSNFLKLSESFLLDYSEEVFDLFSVTARCLWLWRNEWIHEGSFTHPNCLVTGAQRNVDDYKLVS